MDGLTFYKLMRILNNVLNKSKLNTVTINNDSVYLSFYKEGIINLEFRAAPAPPVLQVTKNVLGEAPGALSAIHGGTITNIGTYGYERAGFIEIKKRKASGKILTYNIILEPAGNYANFFLINEDKVILYSLSPRTIDPDRNIGAGGTYSLPKANKRFSLKNYEGANSFNDLSGFYPITSAYADLIMESNGLDFAVNFINESLDSNDNFYINEKGKVIPFFSPSFNDENGCLKEGVKTCSWQELGNYFAIKNNSVMAGNASKRIKKIFSQKRDKFIELASKLEKELINASTWNEMQAEADFLKSNLYKVTGPGKYIFEKYTDTGIEEVKIEVKYNDNIKENVDKLFKKSARLKKSIPLIEERLQDAMQLALSAEEQIYYADTLNDEELSEFEKLLDEEDKSKNKKPKKVINKPFLEYVGDGYRLFIGRNSASNHELVFRYAISDDLWFHARNVPSAHGILRMEGAELNEDLISFAARAVAYYSKYSKEPLIDIDYTYRKYVTKPKNTPIGFVTYKKFKTITCEPFSDSEMKELNLLKENQ